MNSPHILDIQIAADKNLPMESLEVATIIPTGIKGDRYATGNGSFSKTRQENRHISLIASEAIAAASAEYNIDVTFEDTRRNICTIGIDLNALLGKQFKIGEVLVEGVELCTPCNLPGNLSGKDDVRAKFKEAFENRGGLRVRVLETGTITKDSPIVIFGSTDMTQIDPL